jgi:hypothetical protein
MFPRSAAARWRRAGGVAALLMGLVVETAGASPGVLGLVRPPCGLPRANCQHWTQRTCSTTAHGVVRKAHALAGGTRCLAAWPVD